MNCLTRRVRKHELKNTATDLRLNSPVGRVREHRSNRILGSSRPRPDAGTEFTTIGQMASERSYNPTVITGAENDRFGSRASSSAIGGGLSISAMPRLRPRMRGGAICREGPTPDSCTAATPPYSISSSARASSAGGTVMPSASAVFILMTSLKRVGCSTGKSAGRAPLRILSTYTAALRKRSAYIAEYEISPPCSTNQGGTETAGTRCCNASSAARLLGRLG